MIAQHREESILLWQLEALYGRTPAHHQAKSFIELDYKKRRSGVKGEKDLEFPLSFLSDNDYLILHDIRIKDKNGYFQIDTLVLSMCYFLIVEAKNWYGTVLFDGEDQVVRIGDDGKEEGLPNPVSQVNLQRYRLQEWLSSNGIINIPIDYYVVFTSSSTIIKSISPDKPIPEAIIRNNQLLFRIQDMNEKYNTPRLTMEQLHELSTQIIAAHTPRTVNVLEKYCMSIDELIKGVFCPKCAAVPMDWQHGKWVCRSCHHMSKNAHVRAFHDHKLIISDTITNREARELLGVDCPDVIRRILLKEKYSCIGTTKNCYYKLELHHK
ncbi:NERD domain-containing protein [Virgibacillus byunsanensis]|uniref:NERD domain-containing protein n=1 Tax=Virgibacillus byunsanensis TaxID=570945 RepID=A0ABW3LER4_9BACI